MGVWKDIRFAQIFGTKATTAGVTRPLVQNRSVARAATAIFLLRDSVTIFGSFTLAPRLSAIIPDSLASHPHAKPVISQLTVPVLTQLSHSSALAGSRPVHATTSCTGRRPSSTVPAIFGVIDGGSMHSYHPGLWIRVSGQHGTTSLFS
jgi:hypothetical protein